MKTLNNITIAAAAVLLFATTALAEGKEKMITLKSKTINLTEEMTTESAPHLESWMLDFAPEASDASDFQFESWMLDIQEFATEEEIEVEDWMTEDFIQTEDSIALEDWMFDFAK